MGIRVQLVFPQRADDGQRLQRRENENGERNQENLEHHDISICATCIRVPVMRAHAESINLTLKNDLSEEEARKIISEFPGVSLIDDPTQSSSMFDHSDQDVVWPVASEEISRKKETKVWSCSCAGIK